MVLGMTQSSKREVSQLMALEKTMWHKPEMTVLTRSRSEEAVLTACKSTGLKTATNQQVNGCALGSTCVVCSLNGVS